MFVHHGEPLDGGAHQIRELTIEITTGSVRPRAPREVREEVCRYAARRRQEGAPWAVIARETGLDARKLQRWKTCCPPVSSRRP